MFPGTTNDTLKYIVVPGNMKHMIARFLLKAMGFVHVRRNFVAFNLCRLRHHSRDNHGACDTTDSERTFLEDVCGFV